MDNHQQNKINCYTHLTALIEAHLKYRYQFLDSPVQERCWEFGENPAEDYQENNSLTAHDLWGETEESGFV